MTAAREVEHRKNGLSYPSVHWNVVDEALAL